MDEKNPKKPKIEANDAFSELTNVKRVKRGNKDSSELLAKNKEREGE